ncbi:unnamed protein product [Calypogeia fissa]
MSVVAVLSRCPSPANALFSFGPLEKFCLSTMGLPKRYDRFCSSSSILQVDKFIGPKNAAPAPQGMANVLVAAALHTSSGSVDRNDAAPTGPLISPNPQISLEEAVRLQMEALACNDEPRPDHGLEVMYYFANTDGTDSGGSLPQYFGFPSDLYHFGHFALKFKTWCPELINHSGYDVIQTEEVKNAEKGGFAQVTVQARRGHDDSSTWIFTMSKHARGRQLPCWLTTSLRRCCS